MNNTFLQYLAELDQGDLDLNQQYKDEKASKAEHGKAASDFRGQMDSDRAEKSGSQSKEGEPSKGDIVVTTNKKYVITRRDPKGFYIKELGGQSKELLMKHGYKYKAIDKTPLGKVMYKVFK